MNAQVKSSETTLKLINSANLLSRSVTKLGPSLQTGMASGLIGYIPVLQKPVTIFPTVMPLRHAFNITSK